ncbi:isocitrate lyase/phosphoenolpyruvate mutase family protein [Lysobacter sp. TAF61]|uniref:isocitrate lyase/PEP mutase family protein n=1 Tax=Lysobacter sp. TAF61 TaxID=3233072 RepID=UPI003F9C8AA4
MSSSTPQATRFRQLHAQGLLLLANAWDAGSARLIESLGAKAIATTSAGVAWAHGYADGDQLPIGQLVASAASIARVIAVPLSVDVEGGYCDDPATVADNVVRLAEIGAVGINLEDGAGTPELLCAKIERIKRECAQRGLEVFINARTDVYLRGLAPAGQRVAPTLARAALYRAAGADGLFVPGLTEAAEIEAIASQAGLPLNVMLRPNLPDTATLETLGVRRLSAGSNLSEEAFAHTRAGARAFLQSGRATASDDAMGYGAINALFAEG